MCDEEFDSFCCRFTTMSRVMEHGGCRIVSPAWQTKSLGARRQYSQATFDNVIFMDTLRFNNDVDFLYRLATVLEMRLNHEYWCEPECTWQTSNINKTATGDRLDSWASRLWRGIELVFKSLDCFTVRPIFSTRTITRMKSFSFFWGGVGLGVEGAQLQCIYYLVLYIPISRLPRVIRRFKRRSCWPWGKNISL